MTKRGFVTIVPKPSWRGIVNVNERVNAIHISENLKRNLDALNVFIANISEKHALSFEEIISLLKQKESKDILIPTFILRDVNLGVLEAATKYLKEELNLTYHKIAVLLNRDDRVVWVTYNKAIKKKEERFIVDEPNYWLPVSIFTDKKLGPLEAISKYLVDDSKLNFKEIAKLLNRDNRSIWACYRRVSGKLKTIENEEARKNIRK